MFAELANIDSRIRESGRLVQSVSYVSLVDTANTLLLTTPTGATLYLYALWVHNRVASTITLAVGTGATLTQRVPRLGPFVTGYHDIFEIPLAHFESDIYVTSSAGGASPLEVQVKAFAIAVG